MLSRARLTDVQQGSFVSTLGVMDHRDGPAVSSPRWKQIDQFSASNPVMQKLKQVIVCGWPNVCSQLDPFYEHHDTLTI